MGFHDSGSLWHNKTPFVINKGIASTYRCSTGVHGIACFNCTACIGYIASISTNQAIGPIHPCLPSHMKFGLLSFIIDALGPNGYIHEIMQTGGIRFNVFIFHDVAWGTILSFHHGRSIITIKRQNLLLLGWICATISVSWIQTLNIPAIQPCQIGNKENFFFIFCMIIILNESASRVPLSGIVNVTVVCWWSLSLVGNHQGRCLESW